jgi:hypothetical protein
VILDVLVTPAEVTENLPMQEMLFRSRFRWGLGPRSVTGDAAYGTRENITAVEEAGIRAYTALADQQRRTALFTIEDFVYDAQKDLYTCPSGETLRRRGHDHRGSYVRYAAKASVCNACPLKSKCTKSPKGRGLSRGLQEEYLERVRGYRRTEPYRKALRKRQGAKETGGVGGAALRGGQGVARGAEVQAKAAGEGELGGPDSRFGAERKATSGLREQSSKETRAGGRAPTARSRPSGVSRDPETSLEMPLQPHQDPFSTRWGILRTSPKRSSRKFAKNYVLKGAKFIVDSSPAIRMRVEDRTEVKRVKA